MFNRYLPVLASLDQQVVASSTSTDHQGELSMVGLGQFLVEGKLSAVAVVTNSGNGTVNLNGSLVANSEWGLTGVGQLNSNGSVPPTLRHYKQFLPVWLLFNDDTDELSGEVGSVTHEGAMSITGVGSVGIVGSLTANSNELMSGSCSLSESASCVCNSDCGLNAVGITSLTGSMMANAQETILGVSSLSNNGQLTANGFSSIIGVGSLDLRGMLSANSSSTWSSEGLFSLLVKLSANSAISPVGVGLFNPSAEIEGQIEGAASFIGQGIFGLLPSVTAKGTIALTSNGILTVEGQSVLNSILGINGISQFGSVSHVNVGGQCQFNSNSTTILSPKLEAYSTLGNNGVGDLNVSAQSIAIAHLILIGQSLLGADGQVTHNATSHLGEMSLSGNGSIILSPSAIANAISSLESYGIVTFDPQIDLSEVAEIIDFILNIRQNSTNNLIIRQNKSNVIYIKKNKSLTVQR